MAARSVEVAGADVPLIRAEVSAQVDPLLQVTDRGGVAPWGAAVGGVGLYLRRDVVAATAPWAGLDGALLSQCRVWCIRRLSSKSIRVARGGAGEVAQDVHDLHAQ